MLKRIALPLFLLISAQHICTGTITPPPAAAYYNPLMQTRKRESDDTRAVYKALEKAQFQFMKLPKHNDWGFKNEYGMSEVVKATKTALYTQDLVMSQYWVMHPEPMAVMRLYHTSSGQYIESEMPLSRFTPGHGYAPIQVNPSVCTWIRLFLYASLLGVECPLEGEEQTTPGTKSESVEGAPQASNQ